MGDVEFNSNRAGWRAVMKMPGTVAVLQAKAEQVASRARGDSNALYRAGINVRVGTKGRVSSRVFVAADAPNSMSVEAKRGTLARALGA